MLQQIFVVLCVALSFAHGGELDTPDNETVPRIEYSTTITTVGPGSERKPLIVALSSKIQEITKEAFKIDSTEGSKPATDIFTFSTEVGTINLRKLVGLDGLRLVDLETDIYETRTQFNMFIPEVKVQGSFKISENTQSGHITLSHQEIYFSAQLHNISVKGSAVLFLKSSTKQLNYKKFTVKQRAQSTEMELELDSIEDNSNNELKMEQEIGKALLMSALEKAVSGYLVDIQKEANQKIRQINLEEYLPGKVTEFFKVVNAIQSNVDDAHTYLSNLYTKIFREFLDKQLVSMPTVSYPVRRRGLEGTWIYGNMSFYNGYIRGLNSVNVKVGSAASADFKTSSEGMLTFGTLTLSYEFLTEYFFGGSNGGVCSLISPSTTAKYISTNGVAVSITQIDISYDNIKFYTNGPSELQFSTPAQDWRVTTYEDQIKNMGRVKIAQLINDGLRSIYF